MSYTSLLINTCTINKMSQAAPPDSYGNPTVTWTPVAGVACRWSTPSNREVKVGAEVVLADLQLFLGADTDITEQDRVVLDTGATFEVLSAADRQNGTVNHHVECLMRTVR